MLYLQAHIPGAEFIGAGSEPEGIKQLRTRVQSMKHTTSIVLYCGCCPWAHCPNVNPAYAELHKIGFTNVKVLYIANNIGTDWVYKGYPTYWASSEPENTLGSLVAAVTLAAIALFVVAPQTSPAPFFSGRAGSFALA